MNKKQTMYQAINEASHKFSSCEALYYLNKSYSYSHVIEKINRCAGMLIKLGYKKDNVITVCLPNIPTSVYLLYAINQIGAIANLIHPLMKNKQLHDIMLKTKSKILFCLDTFYAEFVSYTNDGILVVPCSPASDLPFLMRFIYKQKCKKELEMLRLHAPKYNDADFLFGELYRDFDVDYFKDAIYLHSGGTSGESKTIALSSFAVNALAAQGSDILNIIDPTKYHMFAVLPMFHGFGLCMGIHAMLCHGGCDTLMPKFHSKETIDLIKKNKCSFLIGVPMLYEALLRNKDFKGKMLRNLNVAFVGGDFVSSSLIERYNERMIQSGSNCRLFEGYGLTETVTVCNVNTHQNHKEGSVGHAINNAKIKIVDVNNGKDLKPNQDGEIYVSGETLMNGYRFETVESDPFIVDKNGVKWVKTGDYGHLDEDDYLYFKQRLKRLVKVNGINIFPSEIENVVASLKEVFECAAIGVEDEKHDHMIKLFVTLDRDSNSKNIDDKINALIKEKCGIYAVPKQIVYLEKMPKTLVGKVDVKLLS